MGTFLNVCERFWLFCCLCWLGMRAAQQERQLPSSAQPNRGSVLGGAYVNARSGQNQAGSQDTLQGISSSSLSGTDIIHLVQRTRSPFPDSNVTPKYWHSSSWLFHFDLEFIDPNTDSPTLHIKKQAMYTFGCNEMLKHNYSSLQQSKPKVQVWLDLFETKPHRLVRALQIQKLGKVLSVDSNSGEQGGLPIVQF